MIYTSSLKVCNCVAPTYSRRRANAQDCLSTTPKACSHITWPLKLTHNPPSRSQSSYLNPTFALLIA